MYDQDTPQHQRAANRLHQSDPLSQQRYGEQRGENRLKEQGRRDDGRAQMSQRVVEREPADDVRHQRERGETSVRLHRVTQERLIENDIHA